MRKHGSNSAYSSGCRCERCRKAHSDYESSRRRRALYDGHGSRSSAMPWQALLRELTLPVMTIEEIAKATGLRPNTLSDIRRGHVAEVNHRTRVELERFVRSLPSEEAS